MPTINFGNNDRSGRNGDNGHYNANGDYVYDDHNNGNALFSNDQRNGEGLTINLGGIFSLFSAIKAARSAKNAQGTVENPTNHPNDNNEINPDSQTPPTGYGPPTRP